MKRTIINCAILSCLPILLNASWCLSQQSPAEEQTARKSQVGVKEAEDRDAENFEEQAIAFVNLHHPELASLLGILKTADRSKYDAAIKDVTKVLKRLEGSRKRDEKLHQMEITSWTIQSKIDLLLAKGVAKDYKVDEEDLKSLIEQRIDNQILRTEREVELLEQRRAKLLESLDKWKSNRDMQIDKQASNLLKRIGAEKSKASKREP